MLINEMLEKRIAEGMSLGDARNVVAEEILLKKIASSELAEHVALKGGIVMYNLTKNERRVTKDLDFDLIRYSIDDESIRFFIKKMNNLSDKFNVFIDGKIEELNQEDYSGKRVYVIIKDSQQGTLKLKLDIGVHTYMAIEQENMIYSFETDDTCVSLKVNSPNQIVAEKLISLARLGAISQRFKDLYDVYYLLDTKKVNETGVRNILSLFFENSKRKPNNFLDFQNSIEDTLNNTMFAAEVTKIENRWFDVEYELLKSSIIDFVNKL